MRRGIAELREGTRLEPGRVRAAGAGRPRLTESDPTLIGDLKRLVDPDTRGDPESPLRWCSKSLGKIAGALVAAGHHVSDRSAAKLLRGLGFRLHANQKTREGKQHPDRDAQFRHINETTRAALAAGEPTISVDAKKRELGVPRTQQEGRCRRSVLSDAVTASEMEGLARLGLVVLRGRPAGGGCKPPQGAAVKSRGVERCGEGAPLSASGVG